jgi:hypothetical protein
MRTNWRYTATPREGEIKIGDTALDSPSDREVARRERMKREG